jgi:hypothetical protein
MTFGTRAGAAIPFLFMGTRPHFSSLGEARNRLAPGVGAPGLNGGCACVCHLPDLHDPDDAGYCRDEEDGDTF